MCMYTYRADEQLAQGVEGLREDCVDLHRAYMCLKGWMSLSPYVKLNETRTLASHVPVASAETLNPQTIPNP